MNNPGCRSAVLVAFLERALAFRLRPIPPLPAAPVVSALVLAGPLDSFLVYPTHAQNEPAVPGNRTASGRESRSPGRRGVAFTSHRIGLKSPEADDLLRKIESLRPRLSKLSEASRRVSESLDVNTVLREVIDNARYLTGARYGALLTHEPSGSMQDLITSGTRSRGGSAADDPAPGAGTLGYMNEVREPLRLRDIASHPSSTGFPENHPPMKTFLGMALRPRRALP